ncbi:MAG: ATP-binding protein [Nitrospiria bacterium]
MSKEKNLNPTALEAAFLEHEHDVRFKRLKTACLLIVVLMPAGISLDYFIYPEYLWFFLKLRVLCALLAGVAWIGLTLVPVKKHLNVLEILVVSLPAVFISWMIFETEGAASPYYAGLCLVLIGAGLIMFWTLKQNLLFQGIVIMMYVSVCILHGDIEDGSVFFNSLYFTFLTMIIVVAGSYNHRKLFSSEFAHGFELNEHRAKLEETNRSLVELDRMKSRFFANISHELRTPLTLIQTPLESLRVESGHLLPDEVQGDLDLIQRNVHRLLRMINDLLDLVKLESGKMAVNRDPLQSDKFIKGLVLSIENAALEKGVSLSTSIEEMPPILADGSKLEKIVLNLLTNAIKFTPSGGRVSIQAEKKGEVLILTVEDSGIGIPEEHMDHIFDRFWQGKVLSRGKYQGTGIGLSIVKESVEIQGGQVSVKSQPGRGTNVTIYLPAPDAPRSALSFSTDKEGSKEMSSGEQLGFSGEENLSVGEIVGISPDAVKPRPQSSRSNGESENIPSVLIVEDEPDMRQFLRSQLDHDFIVQEAVAGEEAIEKAVQSSPDLVLLDIMIPGKDGIEVCHELRKNLRTHLIPIIILTARADEKAKLEALSNGASDFLTKPFSSTELHLRIWNLIRSYQFQRDLAKQKETVESTLKQLKLIELQLVQTEKMASLGRWSAGIIHEVNNPLNFSFSAIYMLKQRTHLLPKEAQASFGETLNDLEEGMARIKNTVRALRDFVHPDSSQFDWVTLGEVAKTAIKFAKDPLTTNVIIDVDISEHHKVWGNKNALVHVLINLVENALDAVRKKSFQGAEPGIWIKSRLEGGKTLLIIRDNGVGISMDYMDQIFDPFFTTKDVGEGMGLGLGICYGILQQHGAAISAKSEPGQYTEFIITMSLERQEREEKRMLERVQK